MSTTASVSEAQSSASPDAARSGPTLSPDILNRAPGGLLPSVVEAVLSAAEALAATQMKPWTGIAPGGRVIDAAFCTHCQRQQTTAGLLHGESCSVGQLLAAVAALRGAEGLGVLAAEYRRGWQDGQARTLELQMAGGLADRAEMVSFPPSGFFTPARAQQIQRELDAAERKKDGCEHRTTVSVCLEGKSDMRQCVDCHATLSGRELAGLKTGAVCGRAIAVFGLAGRDLVTCGLESGHGDAWHEDLTIGLKWSVDAIEIHFRPDGAVVTHMLGREPEFNYDRCAQPEQVAR